MINIAQAAFLRSYLTLIALSLTICNINKVIQGTCCLQLAVSFIFYYSNQEISILFTIRRANTVI